jgi:hypothetical protein
MAITAAVLAASFLLAFRTARRRRANALAQLDD